MAAARIYLPDPIIRVDRAGMTEVHAEQVSLAELMGPLAARSGVNPSLLPGVSFQRITAPLARSPAVYQPSLKIVGQGRIRSYLGREVYSYDADHYLALVVPLPVECDLQASLSEPLLFMSLDLEWTLLGTLLKVTATSPQRYLQHIRLHRARSLLRHERLPVAVAAARVGYESPSQFSREFRRLFGCSPTADLKRLSETCFVVMHVHPNKRFHRFAIAIRVSSHHGGFSGCKVSSATRHHFLVGGQAACRPLT